MLNVVKATARLYYKVARQAFNALKKHPFKPLFGFLFILAIRVLESSGSFFPGFVGGMIIGLAMTLVLASFLAFISLIFDSKRFNREEVQATALAMFGPLINTLFLLFIGLFLLKPILMAVDTRLWLGIIYIVLFVLFNPLPEVASRRGVGGMQAFGDSLEFMKENGPEWLAGILILFLPLIAIAGPTLLILLISSADPLQGLFLLIGLSIQVFASLFDFLDGQFGSGVRLIAMAFGLYYLFFIFLSRAALFEELSHSTRRKRVREYDLS